MTGIWTFSTATDVLMDDDGTHINGNDKPLTASHANGFGANEAQGMFKEHVCKNS